MSAGNQKILLRGNGLKGCEPDREAVHLVQQDAAEQPSPGEEGKGISLFLVLIVAVAAITGFMMGYDLSIVAVVLEPVREHFSACGPEAGALCVKSELFVAILPPGAVVGSLCGGYASDKFGRRAVLITSDLFFVVAGIVMFAAKRYGGMLLGRLLLGIGIGLGFVVFPTYMAEVSPANIRGALGMAQEIAQCAGVLFAYALSSIAPPSVYWRILLLTAGLPAVLQLGGSLILPESPRWLVGRKKLRAARNALERIAGLRPALSRGAFRQATSGSESGGAFPVLPSPEVPTGPEIEPSLGASGLLPPLSHNDSEWSDHDEDLTEEFSTVIPNISRISSKGNLSEVCPQVPEGHEDIEFALIEAIVEAPQREGSLYSDSMESRVSRVRAARLLINEARITSNPSLLVTAGASRTSPGCLDDFLDDAASRVGSIAEDNHQLDGLGGPDNPIRVLLDLMEEWAEKEEQKEDRRKKRRKRWQEELRALEKEDKSRWGRLFWRMQRRFSHRPLSVDKFCAHRYSLFIALGCAISNDFIGAGTILYYSVDLMRMAGVCNILFTGVMIGLVKFLGVLILVGALERVGRRIPLLLGSFGLLLCHLGLAATFKFGDFLVCPADLGISLSSIPRGVPAIAVVTLTLLLMAFWSLSWSGLMFVVSSEVLPSSIRGAGMGCTIATFWSVAFLFQLFFRPVISLISASGAFLVLAFTTFLVLLFTYCCIPELTGLSLEVIGQCRAELAETNLPNSESCKPKGDGHPSMRFLDS